MRRDKKGATWFVSTTSNGYRKVTITKGETTSVAIDPAIHVNLRVKHQRADKPHGGLRANMAINGERIGGPLSRRRVGLSIYQNGKRIPVPIRGYNAAGEVVASGTMKYG